MKKIYRHTELGKLKFIEFNIYIISFLAVPIAIASGNNIIMTSAFIMLLGMNLFLVKLYLQGRGNRTFPRYYGISLYLLLFSCLSIILLVFTPNPTVLTYGFVISLFAYLLVSGIIFYFLINLIFIYGLKKMFPHELKVNVRQENGLSLKKLSRYIDLDRQKLYFSISLINFIIYLVFIFFGMLLFIKYQNEDQLIKIRRFSTWVKNEDSITLFNGVSLFSLMIAVYTVTFSAQRKIIDEAENRYSEERKKYL
ncbi:hypothetical protein [Sporosarcina sp.]|uniref:hypothetical protein n=1 Tax=Sporosarcina sp. TaxID=49982 RepID=UPI002636A09F|nr:hypothetical protein [Sporosarcina sp.]